MPPGCNGITTARLARLRHASDMRVMAPRILRGAGSDSGPTAGRAPRPSARTEASIRPSPTRSRPPPLGARESASRALDRGDAAWAALGRLAAQRGARAGAQQVRFVRTLEKAVTLP